MDVVVVVVEVVVVEYEMLLSIIDCSVVSCNSVKTAN